MLLMVVPAAAANETFRLTYDAPWECPARDYFGRQLGARLRRLSLKDPGNSAMSLDVRISNVGSAYSGHIRLVDIEGALVERDVDGSTCVDVVAALALISAIALDTSHNHSRANVGETFKPQASHLAIGVLGGIHTAISDGVAPTLGLSATVRRRNRFGEHELRLSTLVGFNGRMQASDALGQPAGGARFLWLAARISGCPFQTRRLPVSLGGCAILEVGALRGTGLDTVGAQSRQGPWLAPGVLFNASIQTSPLTLRLAAGGVRPLIRDRFLFSPETTIFRPPSLGLVAELEVSWEFN